MNVPLSAWVATVVPAACWLIYRILVLRYLARALDASPEHARVMASAIRTALSLSTERRRGRPACQQESADAC